MISNERPSPFSRRPQRPQYGSSQHGSSFNQQPAYNKLSSAYSKPASPENTLKTERVQIERKTFVFMLKENDRGRFLRIVEESNGHRDMIIVPSTGLEEFNKTLSEIVAHPPTKAPEQLS